LISGRRGEGTERLDENENKKGKGQGAVVRPRRAEEMFLTKTIAEKSLRGRETSYRKIYLKGAYYEFIRRDKTLLADLSFREKTGDRNHRPKKRWKKQ